MAATFTAASSKIHEQVRTVIDRWHPDLAEAKVKIGIVMAFGKVNDKGEYMGPPMARKGFRILGKIKINGQADRVDGKPDATLTLDGDHWEDLDSTGLTADQEALIDHELYHLIVLREPSVNERPGEVKRDIHNRPELKSRPHDYELTGFIAVIERNGVASVEVQEVKHWHDAHGNLVFSFANDLAESYR